MNTGMQARLTAKWVMACAMMVALLAFGSTVRADEAMAYIPADVDVVGSADVQALYAHEQLAFVRGMVEDDLDEDAERLKGMKVFPDNIQRLVFGVKIDVDGGEPHYVVVVEMKDAIDAEAFGAFLADEGETASVAGQTVYTSPDEGMQVAILSPKRVLVASVPLMEAGLSKANPVTGNATLMQAASIPARKETLWMAAVATKELLASMGDDVPPFVQDLTSALLTIHLAEKLDLLAVTNFTNEESAAAMMGLMQMAVPQAMMMGSQMGLDIEPKATVEGKAAKMTISTTPDVIQQAGNMFMMMMMGGMMMQEEPMLEDDVIIEEEVEVE